MAYKLSFIGSGNMAEAILKGVLSSGLYEPGELLTSDPDGARRAYIKTTYHVESVADNACCLEADTVILAVKPQMAEAALSPLKPEGAPLFISLLAGTSLERLRGLLPGMKMIRAVPNTPAMTGAGITALSAGADVTAEEMATASRIFEAVGECFSISEDRLNAVSALSGSGPAYFFIVIEALSDAGVKLGLPRALAIRLAAATAFGAGRLALDTGLHPGQLKDMVTSPAGTTIEAVAALEAHGVRSAFISAALAAFDRSRTLS